MEGILAGPSRYFSHIWRMRYFLTELVKNDLYHRYKRSFFGIGWSLLKPISMTAIFCVVFGSLFDVPIAEYAPYVLLGVTTWQFFNEALLQGSHSFTNGSAYIKQQKVPLAIFPLRTVLGSAFHSGIALVVAIVITISFALWDGDPNKLPTPALALVVPAFLLLVVLGWCMAIVSGVVGTHFPDFRHMLEVGLQILFYLSPILYKANRFEGKRYGILVECNPVTSLLALVRDPVLYGTAPPLTNVAIAVGFTALFALLAVVLLRRLERNLIFWI